MTGLTLLVIGVMGYFAYRERTRTGKYNGWFWVFTACAVLNVYSLFG